MSRACVRACVCVCGEHGFLSYTHLPDLAFSRTRENSRVDDIPVMPVLAPCPREPNSASVRGRHCTRQCLSRQSQVERRAIRVLDVLCSVSGGNSSCRAAVLEFPRKAVRRGEFEGGSCGCTVSPGTGVGPRMCPLCPAVGPFRMFVFIGPTRRRTGNADSHLLPVPVLVMHAVYCCCLTTADSSTLLLYSSS